MRPRAALSLEGSSMLTATPSNHEPRASPPPAPRLSQVQDGPSVADSQHVPSGRAFEWMLIASAVPQSHHRKNTST
ncbi:unnamed protein product [Arctogadus glacialis]